MSFFYIFYQIDRVFRLFFIHMKLIFDYIHTKSLNHLRSLLQAYPDITSISLFLIILYLSLYILGRTFRTFKIFLRIFFLLIIIWNVIYILQNGVDAAYEKFNSIRTYIRDLAFFLIDKKSSHRIIR